MTERKQPFATVEEALEEIRAGRMIVLVDDEDRENEGDLAMAAEKVTPEAINFMAKFGRGLICLALPSPRETLLRSARRSVNPLMRVAAPRRAPARPTAPPLFWPPPIPTPAPKISRAPATFTLCARATAECSFALGKPKLPWISPASPDWTIPA